jgi:hypothetical protein
MTIVGMAIVIAQLWREVGPLRAEVRHLRDEVGKLSIDDESKIHAIEVRSSEPLLWKWRVWVPQGQSVLVRSQWGNIPSSGVPPAGGSLHLKPGENWITLRAHPSPSGNSWSAQLETATSSVGFSIQEPDRWWQWPTTSSTAEGAGFTTTVAGERDPIFILKRVRVSPIRNPSKLLRPTAPTAGFVVWLERQ